jgi:hypothetical protein
VVEEGDTIVPLLTVVDSVVTQLTNILDREFRIYHLGFLQADDVWRVAINYRT